MTIQERLFKGALAAAFLGMASLAGMAEPLIVSHSKDIVVVRPTNLPELAQRHGIAFQLYTGNRDGNCYLYIEQHNGERLLVLDVTDPAHIKMVRAVPLTVPAPFDFVRNLGTSAFLVRFRNNLGTAVLDLRKPKDPLLKTASSLQYPGHTESLGDSAFLMANERHVDSSVAPRDYQIIDASDPADPSVLFTVKQVNGKIARNDTGTTFLLGAEGLTVIRRPKEEEKFKMAEDYTN